MSGAVHDSARRGNDGPHEPTLNSADPAAALSRPLHTEGVSPARAWSTVIEQLADELEVAKALIIALEDAVDMLRVIATVAVGRCADLSQKQDRLREQHHRLQDEFRSYRAKTITEAAA